MKSCANYTKGKEPILVSIQKYIAYLKTIETSSITKAAAQLGYTQSAVSRMIADLEKSWNVTLLTRNRSGIEISSEGLMLLPKLQVICSGYESLNRTVAELHSHTSGSIRVGTFSSFSCGLLPAIIKAFHETYPHITFNLLNGEYNEIAGWLRKGLVDCGFVALPAADDLDTSYLVQDSLVAVLPKDHPMAEAPYFPVDMLAHEDFINVREEQDYEIAKFLDELQQKPKIRYESSDDYAILSMVESGLGISVVHDLMLVPNRYNVVAKPFDVPIIRDIAVAVKKDATLSTITQLFVDHTKTWARQQFLSSIRG